MDILLIFVLITVIVGFAIVLFVMTQRIESLKKDQTSGYIKQDMIELTRGVGELRDSLQRPSQIASIGINMRCGIRSRSS